MAGQADDAHVMGKVLTAELGADAQLLGCCQQLVFQFDIAEGLTVFVANGGQAVQVAGGGQFDGLHAGVG